MLSPEDRLELVEIQERPKMVAKLREALQKNEIPGNLTVPARLLLEDPMRLSPGFFNDRVQSLLDFAERQTKQSVTRKPTDPEYLRTQLIEGRKIVCDPALAAEIKAVLGRFQAHLIGTPDNKRPLKGRRTLSEADFVRRARPLLPLINEERRQAQQRPAPRQPRRRAA